MAKRDGIGLRPGFLAFVLTLTLCIALAEVAALFPQADGATVYKDGGTTVDASHADQGYVMVCHAESSKALKLRITLGDDMLTYDLASDGKYETYPLTFGSGKYKIQVFKQVSGKRYSNDSSLSFSAEIQDETLPYLYPNQYVWYTPQSAAVAKAAELCSELSTARERVDAIYRYVISSIVYDYLRARTVKTGYIPDIDAVLAEGKGICFDYSALTACMLRAQGIPAKLVIGYADQSYHAWNSVLLDGKWLRIDTTADANQMKIKKYTDERTY